jgi:gluconate 2-dehydrogenase alpha chain
MAIKKDKVDVVMVGLGWTGSIMGMELTEAGLNVLALERGDMRDTNTDTPYPKAVDELKYSVRGALFQDLSRETVTIRHTLSDVACIASMVPSCWAMAWAVPVSTGTA